jgi:hypothetical protein
MRQGPLLPTAGGNLLADWGRFCAKKSTSSEPATHQGARNKPSMGEHACRTEPNPHTQSKHTHKHNCWRRAQTRMSAGCALECTAGWRLNAGDQYLIYKYKCIVTTMHTVQYSI